MKFTCPECNHNKLEEVLSDVTVISEISSIDENGEVEYGKQTNCDGSICRYECKACGFILLDDEKLPIVDVEGLVEWLKYNT